MILTILSILLLVALGLFIYFSLKKDTLPILSEKEIDKLPKEEKKKYKKENIKNVSFVVAVLVFFVMLFFVAINTYTSIWINLPRYRDEILKEKSLIIYKIEHNEYETDVEMITEINEFNEDVEKAKKRLKNPWINWYTSRHYKDIDAINYTIDFEIKDKKGVPAD